MTEKEADKAKAVAAGGAGAGIGGAGGATVGVLGLAAQGLATNLMAGVVVGAGAVFGALAGYGLYRLVKRPSGKQDRKPGKSVG